jgi:hypothetical protein
LASDLDFAAAFFFFGHTLGASALASALGEGVAGVAGVASWHRLWRASPGWPESLSSVGFLHFVGRNCTEGDAGKQAATTVVNSLFMILSPLG